MVKLYPTNPGFSREWTVEIDFEKNGFEKLTRTFASWDDGIEWIREWLGSEVKL